MKNEFFSNISIVELGGKLPSNIVADAGYGSDDCKECPYRVLLRISSMTTSTSAAVKSSRGVGSVMLNVLPLWVEKTILNTLFVVVAI